MTDHDPRRAGDAGEQHEERLSRRPLRSDRKMVLAMAVVALGVAALSVSYYQFYRVDPTPLTPPRLLKVTLVAGNVLLLFALAFFLLRYLIRLLSERRAGILGSRFKLKLVTTFIVLCMLPAFMLYAAAIWAISTAVDRALSPDTDRLVADAALVADQFYAYSEAELGRELGEMMDSIAPGDGGEALPSRESLQREVGARGLAAARLELPDGRSVEAIVPDAKALLAEDLAARPDPGADASEGPGGSGYARGPVRRGGELYLVAGAPLARAGGEPRATLVIARHVPADLESRAQRLQAVASEHRLLKAQRGWIKVEQALLFFGLLLVIMFAATWVSLYVAKSITVPIQRLAHGTREVRRGNLAHVVTWQGGDELADLVEAFNAMARDLGRKADEVDGKTRELEAAHVALERAYRELERRRDHMERLLESMGAGVLALDAAGQVVVANRAAWQVLQLPATTGPGRHFTQALAGDALAEVRDMLSAALGQEGLRQARELVLGFESGPVHVQVLLAAQPDVPGGGVGLLALFEDVTELVRAQKLATWRAVARRIAHEIKNPLTPIQLSAQRILKKYRAGAPDLAEALESGVETIVAEVAGLKQMVDEFSQFARMPDVRPVPGDLNAMLSSVAALYGGHERLSVDLDLAQLPPVPFDPEQLRRAVVNLVDNAVEATAAQGRITLQSALGPGRTARIVVADDGPGVARGDRDKLFLPYFTTKSQGTGLGLAIVNRIVSDHDGRVSVEDARPRGARFVIELPLAARVGAASPAPAPPAASTG